jgi:tetratricopeptide (TPR) repeat protein
LSSAAADSLIHQMDTTMETLLRAEDYGSAFRFLDSLKQSVAARNHYGLTAAWWSQRGTIFYYQSQVDSAQACFKLAVRTVEKVDSASKYIIRPLAQFARLWAHQEKYDTALVLNLRVSEIARKVDSSSLPEIYKNLALLYSYIGDDINQRKYLFEGYELARHTTLRPIYANNIAKYYVDKHQLDSAERFFYQSLRDTSLESTFSKATAHENLGVLLSLQNKLHSGLRHMLIALTMYKGLRQADGQIYLSVAEVYSRLGRYALSNAYLDTARQLAKTDDPALETSIVHKMADNYKNVGEFKMAYDSLNAAFELHEKNDSSSFLRQAHEIETRYAVKAKDEEIQTLAFTNETSKRISQQQRIIILFMVVILLLGTLLVIVIIRRRRLQLVIRETELQQQLLRSEISSHFLFNTFTILQRLLDRGDLPSAARLLLQLATLLRISLENARQNRVSLHKEITAIESYLQLCQFHVDTPFTYQVQVYDGYAEDDVLIPPMLLQPFVENAIFHGMASRQAGGLVEVRVDKNGGSIVCTIDDNGVGLRPTAGSGKQSLATIITQDRLAILHRQLGRPASLQVIDKRETGGEGVKVLLVIPYVREF